MAPRMDEIRELIRLIDESSIDEFTWEHENSKISIKKVKAVASAQSVVSPPAVGVAPTHSLPTVASSASEAAAQPKQEETAETEEENLHKIVSPLVGTFYRAPSPESPPYVQEGDTVTPTTKVCIVEAMKVMNEIEADVEGTIVKVLAENGQLVEYGQPLFLVKTN